MSIMKLWDENSEEWKSIPTLKGDTGPKGDQGPPGIGVPLGGVKGQILIKKSGTAHDTEWSTDITIEDGTIKVNGIPPGWQSLGATVTFSSADAPTFVVTTSIDCTEFIGLGNRLQCTHGGVVKYFLVTAITSNSITLYGGTDYTLSDTAITEVYYSNVKAPYGFPMSKTKWTLSNQITSSTSKASPVNDTWYNIGGSLTVPVGLWIPKYSGLMAMIHSSTGNVNQFITISTKNNDATNDEYTQKFSGYGNIEVDISVFLIGNPLLVESPTTYYLNCKKEKTSTGQTAIYLLGKQQPTILQFECAYL